MFPTEPRLLTEADVRRIAREEIEAWCKAIAEEVTAAAPSDVR
jgi:hypothetical protein